MGVIYEFPVRQTNCENNKQEPIEVSVTPENFGWEKVRENRYFKSEIQCFIGSYNNDGVYLDCFSDSVNYAAVYDLTISELIIFLEFGNLPVPKIIL